MNADELLIILHTYESHKPTNGSMLSVFVHSEHLIYQSPPQEFQNQIQLKLMEYLLTLLR